MTLSFNTEAQAILLLLLFILITSIFRTFYLSEVNIRDYMEIFRYLPLFLLMLLRNKLIIPYEKLCLILCLYTGLDALISILQTTSLSTVSAISRTYASEFHYQYSLIAGNRAIGLNRGPGDHGALMVFLSVFFFSNLFYQPNRYIKIGIALSSVAILVSQSQTSFIALSFSVVLILLYFLAVGNRSQKKLAKKTSLYVSICGLVFFTYFFVDLRYLYSLVEQGTNRNSFLVRIEKSEFVHQEIVNDPILFIVGFGKDYWGSFSASMDNEYLYIYSVYGVIVFMAAVLVVLFRMVQGFVYNLKKSYNRSLLFVTIAGLIVAYPTAYFTEPRIIILLFIVNLSIVQRNLEIRNNSNVESR